MDGLRHLALRGGARRAPIAGTQIDLAPSTNSGNTSYAIVATIPAHALDTLMAAFDLTIEAGTLAYGFAVRFYPDPANPSGACTSLANYTTITVSELRNSGTVSVTPGTNLWCQVGVKWSGTDVVGTLGVFMTALWT